MEPKIRALVFDMDGLLFDSERVVQNPGILPEKGWGILGLGITFIIRWDLM